jgi:hypothetical protein
MYRQARCHPVERFSWDGLAKVSFGAGRRSLPVYLNGRAGTFRARTTGRPGADDREAGRDPTTPLGGCVTCRPGGGRHP